MTVDMQTVLVLLIFLQIKHMFADFFLQTPRMLVKRSDYIHAGRVQHAGVHAILSVVCLIAVGAPLIFVLILCLVEGIVHYHIDWVKGSHSEKSGEGPTDGGYWRAFGIDQLMHQLTYVAMIWAWARFVI